MKKVFIIFSSVIIFCSCNSSSDKAADTKTADTTTVASSAPATPAADPEVAKGLELISKSDCLTCHKLTEKLVGPSYADVAAKFKNAGEATMDTLAQKVIKGGAGSWGEVPMLPHPALSKEDVKTMLHYIMSIKK